MDSIENEAVVSMEYVIADKDGNILDSSQEQIMTFVFGAGQMLAAVEQQLLGKKVDDEIRFQLSASEAYGDYDESLLLEVGPEVFEEGLKIYEGMYFQNDNQFVRVTKIADQVITADGNHPFAGQDLTWHIVVVDLRAATYQEILNGQTNTSGHPCGEEMAAGCDKKDVCQTHCGK